MPIGRLDHYSIRTSEGLKAYLGDRDPASLDDPSPVTVELNCPAHEAAA